MNCGFNLQQEQVRLFRAHHPIAIGDLLVTAFPKFHDACEPHSFIISCNNVNVGVFTDIGVACEQLTNYFRLCHAAFLESNYDEEMLIKGSYPYHLKKRISGGRGHLSNRQAFEFFSANKPAHMSCLILAHLSKNNNCPKLVEELFKLQNHGAEIIVASRYEETPVFNIRSQSGSTAFFKPEKADADFDVLAEPKVPFLFHAKKSKGAEKQKAFELLLLFLPLLEVNIEIFT